MHASDSPRPQQHPRHTAHGAPGRAPGEAQPLAAGGPPAPERAPHPRRRIEAIDLARGAAVALMILSHGVNGLLSFEQFTDWGMVPVHAVTKFASSLFITVFGIALAVAFVPHARSADWPRRRLKLLLTALVVFFWYKVLTIVEMSHLYEPQDIVDALLYRAFPSYVEILGFYAIALLWLPFFLPLWARMPAWLQWSSPVLMTALWWLLAGRFGFWGIEPLEALIVEHEDYYTWGQLSRGPLVLVGLLIGGLVHRHYADPRARRRLAAAIAGIGALLLLAYLAWAAPDVGERLQAIARNAGKHPPEPAFMAWSMGGAMLILGAALLGGERAAAWLRPITVIGSDALKAFVFHIFVIFVFFRSLLGWFQAITYLEALSLAVALILATAAWIKLTSWVQQRS